MTAPQDPEAYIRSVEAFSRRAFSYRAEIIDLLATCRARGQQQMFDDLVFNAKFVSNALAILKRVGADNADAAKLGAELREMLEKTTTLLRTIVKESPDPGRQKFLDAFLTLSQSSMSNLTVLLAELSWVKNFMLDKNPSR